MTDQISPHALAHAILTRLRSYILPGHHNDFMRDLQELLEELEAEKKDQADEA